MFWSAHIVETYEHLPAANVLEAAIMMFSQGFLIKNLKSSYWGE